MCNKDCRRAAYLARRQERPVDHPPTAGLSSTVAAFAKRLRLQFSKLAYVSSILTGRSNIKRLGSS